MKKTSELSLEEQKIRKNCFHSCIQEISNIIKRNEGIKLLDIDSDENSLTLINEKEDVLELDYDTYSEWYRDFELEQNIIREFNKLETQRNL